MIRCEDIAREQFFRGLARVCLLEINYRAINRDVVFTSHTQALNSIHTSLADGGRGWVCVSSYACQVMGVEVGIFEGVEDRVEDEIRLYC